MTSPRCTQSTLEIIWHAVNILDTKPVKSLFCFPSSWRHLPFLKCLCVCSLTCEHMCTEAQEWHWELLPLCCPPHPWRNHLLLNSELAISASLASQLAPGISRLCLLHTGITDCTPAFISVLPPHYSFLNGHLRHHVTWLWLVQPHRCG